MNVWFIYFINTVEPYLYAITDKMSLLNSFKQQRNMDVFSVSKHEMDKDEFLKLCQSHSMYLLCDRGLYTSITSLSGDETKGYVDITVTNREDLEIVRSEDKFYEMLERRFKMIPIVAFNKELLLALNFLGYFHVYKYVLAIHGFNDSFLEGIDIETPWLNFDQLAWFICTHETMFKK